MSAAATLSRRRNLEAAREEHARKRKAAKGELENEERVSPRTVKKLRTNLDDTRSALSALQDHTNTLEHRVEAQGAANRRLRLAATSSESSLVSTHDALVSTLRATISDLEVRLSRADSTIADLRKSLKAANARMERFQEHREAHISLEVAKRTADLTTFRLKDCDGYRHDVADLGVSLMSLCGVSSRKVGLVIELVATCAGLTVVPARHVSQRTSLRWMDQVNIVNELLTATKITSPTLSGLCSSADSTSDRKLNYMARHLTVTDSNGDAEMLCLGLTRPVNHTAAVTHQETVELVHQLSETHGAFLDFIEAETRSGSISDESVPVPESSDTARGARRMGDDDYWCNVKATNSDHASDMALVSDMTFDEKMLWERRRRGLEALKALPDDQYNALLGAELHTLIGRIGVLPWLQLSVEDQTRHKVELRDIIVQRLGQAALDALSPAELADVKFFVRAGCCMHKDLNAVVAANTWMTQAWSAAGLQSPVKHLNRDNAAAAALGPSEAADRAADISIGGGAKTTQSLGCLLNHPDHKKGTGDPFRLYMVAKLGFQATIPGTYQSRFQSTYEMARFIIRFRDLIIDYFEQLRAMKGTHDFNNLEQNVYNALHDGPTLSELVTFAAYGTAIGRPYMHEVRARALVNHMTLGPLHDEVIELCEALSQCPELLVLEPDDEGCVGSLDGQPFDDPFLLPAIRDLESKKLIPHLHVPMRAFFAGACSGWKHFSREFRDGGSIAIATAAQRASVFIPSTNDANEGLLGAYRVWKRLRPRMRLRFFNAAMLFGRNKLLQFMQSLTPRGRIWLRAEQRRRERLGFNKRQDALQVAHDAQKRVEGQAAMDKAKERRDKLERELNLFAPIRFRSYEILVEFSAKKRLTGDIIDKNIRWHRHRGQPDVMKKLKLTKPLPTRVAGKRALLDAILRFCDDPTAYEGADKPFKYD